MQVFCRNARGGGAIWESPSATNLKGWDDSYLLLNYKNAEGKSRILLLYNDGKIAESSNSRRSLGLYYLADSAKVAESGLDSVIKFEDTEFMAHFTHLQNIDAVDETYPNEVSYPSAVIDGSALFVGYTYNRKAIKLRKINLVEIERKIAESRGNSSLGTPCGDFGNLGRFADLYPVSHPKFPKNSTTSTANTRICDLDSAESQNLNQNNLSLRADSQNLHCKPPIENIAESQSGLPREQSSLAMTENNDFAESTINYDIFGIYLLFLSAFFFATKSLSKRTKYFALPCFVALISIPFIFVLWERYSIVNLFYSLFGGTSVFCALLCIRYIAIRLLRNLCGSLKNPRSMDLCPIFARIFLRNPQILRKILELPLQKIKQVLDSVNSQNLAPLIALFSIPLFLGHLDLINFDILRSVIFSAIFASAFIVALFWVDRVAFVLALIAVIIDKDFIFGLFDGYLLIFSVIYCAIWAIKSAFKRIIARA